MTFKENWETPKQNSSLSESTYAKMVGQAFRHKKLLSYEEIAGGCANLNIKIHVEDHATAFMLRIYLRDPEAASREKNLGELLHETVPVPRTYYIGEKEGFRFAITEFMPGITLRTLLLGQELQDVGAVMQEVGETLEKIASHTFPKSGFFTENLDVLEPFSKEDYLAFAKECLENPAVVAELKPETISKIVHYLEKYSDLFPDKTEAHLVHGDFNPANILVDKIGNHWKVTGILDWEFSFSGSPLWDVAGMLRYAHHMPRTFQESFLRDLNIVLPKRWEITLHLLNLMSLLDCLKRSDPKNSPNQLSDIRGLIQGILGAWDSRSATKHIEVVAHDSLWSALFDVEASGIKKALGDTCLAIHHIGSTAVPGLAAKPIIDMIAVVENPETSIRALAPLGYDYRGEYNIPRRFLFNKKEGPEVHLHVYEEGHAEIELNLVFRDYLRRNPWALDDYAALKRSLLQKDASFLRTHGTFSGYTLGKDGFIRGILEKAGFQGLRLMHCTHYAEWEACSRLLKKENPGSCDNHFHFILYQGTKMVAAAHVERLEDGSLAYHALAVEDTFQNQNFDLQMKGLINRWNIA